MDQTTETVKERETGQPGTRGGRSLPPDPTPPKRDFRERRRSALSNPRVRLGLITAAVVIVLGGIFAWRYFTSYESTDDA